MEIIAKISRGSKMDQVYIPKLRAGLETGSYVIIKPVSTEQEQIKQKTTKPYLYNIKSIEPIKLEIINKIFILIEKITSNVQNIIITGSFLEKGFKFNDLDILIITESNINEKILARTIKIKLGIQAHIIKISNKELIKGLQTDPLYSLMLSKCVSLRRLIYNIKREINYKILDLHLLKSEPLMYNFNITNGEEKYYLIRNLIAINFFIENKKLTKELIDQEITAVFNLKSIDNIKDNLLNKKSFLPIYKKKYEKTQKKVFSFIK